MKQCGLKLDPGRTFQGPLGLWRTGLDKQREFGLLMFSFPEPEVYLPS